LYVLADDQVNILMERRKNTSILQLITDVPWLGKYQSVIRINSVVNLEKRSALFGIVGKDRSIWTALIFHAAVMQKRRGPASSVTRDYRGAWC